MGTRANPLSFTLDFTGRTVALDAGRVWSEARASTTAVEEGAVCRREFVLHDDGSLTEAGEIAFGDGASVTFRAEGELRSSPDPRIGHGAAILEVTGGQGRLAGASGYITSNFLLSDDGALEDHHLGILFLALPADERPRRRRDRP
ncbi:MAG TPA: hypothetical protein VNK94_13455 [Gaiellaceae bacterium]|jgi:hypothetical protein|nr:hypothetical protein [Gaiellaceae bacterium]